MAWTATKDWTTGEVVTAADLDEQISANMDFLKKNFALGVAVELTIDSGAVAKTQAHHSIMTESAAAEDDLDTISGGAEGELIILRCSDPDHVVTVKNETGNIVLPGDIVLDNIDKVLALFHNGTSWVPLIPGNIIILDPNVGKPQFKDSSSLKSFAVLTTTATDNLKISPRPPDIPN
jgi:hypothetical protein